MTREQLDNYVKHTPKAGDYVIVNDDDNTTAAVFNSEYFIFVEEVRKTVSAKESKFRLRKLSTGFYSTDAMYLARNEFKRTCIEFQQKFKADICMLKCIISLCYHKVFPDVDGGIDLESTDNNSSVITEIVYE